MKEYERSHDYSCTPKFSFHSQDEQVKSGDSHVGAFPWMIPTASICVLVMLNVSGEHFRWGPDLYGL